MTKVTCLFVGCERPMKARGLCRGHWTQWRRGTDLRPLVPRGSRTAHFEMLAALETDECVVWPYGSSNGYAIIRGKDRTVRAMTVILERHVGPKPTAKHEACHKPGVGCQKRCINYRHLRWGTRSDNMRDREIDKQHLRLPPSAAQ